MLAHGWSRHWGGVRSQRHPHVQVPESRRGYKNWIHMIVARAKAATPTAIPMYTLGPFSLRLGHILGPAQEAVARPCVVAVLRYAIPTLLHMAPLEHAWSIPPLAHLCRPPPP